MQRRDFMKTVGAGSAALLAGSAGADTESDNRPNIILFVTDDQDKHSLGAYGGKTLTPNLDRLAREGMVFHQAYVSSAVCTPSRYSMLTGRYAGRSYGHMYQEACPPGQQGYPSFNVELEDDNMNVGAVLSNNGYATGYVGKFHVGPELKRPKDYEARGLKYIARDAMDNAETSAAFAHNEKWYREYLKNKGFSWAKNIYWGNMQKPYASHNSDWTTEAALEFIEEHQNQPFYLHYCTTLVHGPDRSWRRSMDQPLVSGAGMLSEPAKGMTDRQELLRRLDAEGYDPNKGHAGYTWVDDSVGAILKKLDDLGIGDNTLFVFISDHGSDMKASLFNVDGTNVPCMMRWPNGIKAGVESGELVQNIDLVPTFFDLARVQTPSEYEIDGRSLRPLFGGSKPDAWRDHLYFEMGSARAVCTQDWKYIAVRYTEEQIARIKRSRPEQLPRNMSYIGRIGIGTRGSRKPHFFDADQLYHVEENAKELENLADDPEYKDRLEKMRGWLKKDIVSLGRPFGEFVPGGNAAPPGQVDEQIELVKKIKIRGKQITLPETP